MVLIRDTRRVYVIVNRRTGEAQYWTLSYLRKDCIASFLNGSKTKWTELKGRWSCVKVNVCYEPIV